MAVIIVTPLFQNGRSTRTRSDVNPISTVVATELKTFSIQKFNVKETAKLDLKTAVNNFSFALSLYVTINTGYSVYINKGLHDFEHLLITFILKKYY